MKKVFFVLLALTIVIFSSCTEDNNEASPSIFSEIADIATFHGNFDSEVAIVNTQGGPQIELDDETVNAIMELTETSDLLYVNVHQIQTKQPEQFLKREITFEEAKAYNEQSVQYLQEVITYLKAKNKTVYVVGISFGAFVIQEFIADYGADPADGYLVMVGRLDIDAETWIPFSEGKYTFYEYDNNGDYEIKEIKEQFDTEEKNMAKLAAGLGFNRFTEKLANADLSKLIYVYGDRDEEVGPLSNKEVQFLKDRGAQVILSENGDHDEAGLTGLEILKSLFED